MTFLSKCCRHILCVATGARSDSKQGGPVVDFRADPSRGPVPVPVWIQRPEYLAPPSSNDAGAWGPVARVVQRFLFLRYFSRNLQVPNVQGLTRNLMLCAGSWGSFVVGRAGADSEQRPGALTIQLSSKSQFQEDGAGR